MNPNTVSRALRKTACGSRKLRLTFNVGAVQETDFILNMVNQGYLIISEHDVMRLAAVAATNRWHRDDARVVDVELSECFTNDPLSAEILFIGRMTRALEAIETTAA